MIEIYVAPSLADKLDEFFRAEGIEWEPATDEGCLVKVVESQERQQSDLQTIYSGGWTLCATAMQMSERLGISLAQTGKLLNCLDVKVRQCQLGCF